MSRLCPDYDIKVPFPIFKKKKKTGLFEEMADSWFLAGNVQVLSLDHFVRANNQEVIRDYKGYIRRTQEPT